MSLFTALQVNVLSRPEKPSMTFSHH
jgi:hypothetical protein